MYYTRVSLVLEVWVQEAIVYNAKCSTTNVLKPFFPKDENMFILNSKKLTPNVNSSFSSIDLTALVPKRMEINGRERLRALESIRQTLNKLAKPNQVQVLYIIGP